MAPELQDACVANSDNPVMGLEPPPVQAGVSMITLLICTRNRALSLGRTLESVKRLTSPPNIAWELIVVDNNSTDETRSVVEAFQQTSGVNTHYVFEGRRGASSARNAGIRRAQGEIIAFTDDDMIPERDWLVRIAEICANDKSAGMFFGRTLTMRPDQAKVAIREGDTEETFIFPCNPSSPGSSNNMMIRKSVLEKVGVFDPLLGPGTAIGPSEDIDLTYRVLRSGVTVRYHPDILAYHDHNRLSPQAVRKLLFAYGKGRGGFYCKHVRERDHWALRLLYWEASYFFRGLFRPGKTIASILHLTGMTIGFCMRLGVPPGGR